MRRGGESEICNIISGGLGIVTELDRRRGSKVPLNVHTSWTAPNRSPMQVGVAWSKFMDFVVGKRAAVFSSVYSASLTDYSLRRLEGCCSSPIYFWQLTSALLAPKKTDLSWRSWNKHYTDWLTWADYSQWLLNTTPRYDTVSANRTYRITSTFMKYPFDLVNVKTHTIVPMLHYYFFKPSVPWIPRVKSLF